MFRFHVIGIPHTRTNQDYSTCAFTQKALKFCKMMHRRGHIVYHYGNPGSNPECTENIEVTSNELFESIYGPRYEGSYDLDNRDIYPTFINNTIRGIGERKQKYDIILPFYGSAMRTICDAHPDLFTIEPGIGYYGSFADYRIYESYAWMHCQVRDINSPNWYHTVIPAFFDLEDFTYNGSLESRQKDPYFLFTGRVCVDKGVNIAMQVCEKLGVRLVVAGPMWADYDQLPDWVEYVGPVGVEKRNELMANAVASFVPSQYSEPFGWVVIENHLCGTPVIGTDWGAFPETNINGVTGYRCRTFDDFINATINCLEGKIKPEDCRKNGEKYSFDSIAPMYEKYFQDVKNIYAGKGWYEL